MGSGGGGVGSLKMAVGEGTSVSRWLGLARSAELAERHVEAAEAIKSVVESGVWLAAEDRVLFSTAFKTLVGTKRSAWGVLKTRAGREALEPEQRAGANFLKAKVEAELRQACTEVATLTRRLLDTATAKAPSESEARVFLLKMSGDFGRYLCEISEGREKEAAAEKAEQSYAEAQSVASSTLLPTSAIRLGLALNYSIFIYEIKEDKAAAIAMARVAFDSAIPDLYSLESDAFKDSSEVLLILRENIALWTSNDASPVRANNPLQNP